VDGGRGLRDKISAPLKEHAYEMILHNTGAGLPALLEKVQPDLLLLDTGLPEVSGFEVCGELRATEIGRQTPIMLLAGQRLEEEAVARGLLCGADDFCVVSDRLFEFLARVRVQLRNKRDRDRLRRVRDERDNYKREAIVDPLTSIPNRRSIESAIAAAIAAGGPFAVLFIDVDHFKSINDTFGHDTGDEVLKAVAQCLQKAIRGADRCGRFGGEEFVVVLADVPTEIAVSVAERHRRSIEALRLPVLGSRSVTASVGVAVYDPARPDLNDAAIVRRADAALYEAKRLGRNRVVLAPAEAGSLRLVAPPNLGKLAQEVRRPSGAVPKVISPLEQLLLEKLQSGIAGLPLLPEAASEALRLAGDARTDVARIAKLVDRDPPIAARFVAVATSAVYAGRAGKATNTQQALVRIGLAAARDLLYQVVYERSGSDLPRYRREVVQSFQRSVRTALATRTLAAELGVVFPYAYLAGLLHDIGEARIYRILAHTSTAPEDGAAVADIVAKHHAKAGAGIAQVWKLPPQIVEVCASHHDDPTKVAPHVRLVMASDLVVRLCESPAALPEDSVAKLVALGIRADRVKALVESLAPTLSEVESTPPPAPGATPPSPTKRG
jgi:diguanylate cyclase (GGDEF)-like protein/putative nucleotidyltransferase with HDIG domain